MAYQIEIDPKASRDFDKLDNSVKINLKKYLQKIVNVDNPKAYGKQLTGDLAGYWSYRVVNYRIIADVQDDKLVILIVGIGHRSVIYDELKKRLKVLGLLEDRE